MIRYDDTDFAEDDDSPKVTKTRAILWIGALTTIVVVAVSIVAMLAGSGPDDREKVEVPEGISGAQDGAAGPKACGDADLIVDAHTDALTYAEGVLPKFSLSVENNGKEDCVANLGTKTMVFEVREANESDPKKALWRSTHCQQDPDTRMVILEPKTPLATDPIEWDRTASSEDSCDWAEREAAPAGAYDLHVEIAGVKSKEPAQFLIG